MNLIFTNLLTYSLQMTYIQYTHSAQMCINIALGRLTPLCTSVIDTSKWFFTTLFISSSLCVVKKPGLWLIQGWLSACICEEESESQYNHLLNQALLIGLLKRERSKCPHFPLFVFITKANTACISIFHLVKMVRFLCIKRQNIFVLFYFPTDTYTVLYLSLFLSPFLFPPKTGTNTTVSACHLVLTFSEHLILFFFICFWALLYSTVCIIAFKVTQSVWKTFNSASVAFHCIFFQIDGFHQA